MAKKKSSKRTETGGATDQQSQDKDLTASLSRESSMEDPVEKLQNLKALNAMLLKETVEKRQHVESLVQAKNALERELKRCREEMEVSAVDLNRSSEKNLELEVEKFFLRGVFGEYVREMVDRIDGVEREKSAEIDYLKGKVQASMTEVESQRSRLSQVCFERDSIVSELDLRDKEFDMLKKRMVELEEQDSIMKRRVEKLQDENNKLVEEEIKMQDAIVEAVRNRNDLEGKLQGTVKEVERMEGEIEGLLRERKEMETSKNELISRISLMETESSNFDQIISELKCERRCMRGKLSESELSSDLALEKERDMKKMIDALTEENVKSAKELKVLMEENSSISAQIETARCQIMEKERLIDTVRRENTECVERLASRDTELAGLNREREEDRRSLAELKSMSIDTEEKMKSQTEEIECLFKRHEQLIAEKSGVENVLREEKMINTELNSRFREIEKRIRVADAELESLKTGRIRLLQEKREMEAQCASLIEEKGVLVEDLYKMKQAFCYIESKLETTRMRLGEVFDMVKTAATMMSRGEARSYVFNENIDEDMKPFAGQLELIIKAAKEKEAIAEERRKQIQAMESSVAQAQKKKNIAALISAAAVGAAALAAYLTK